MRPGEKLEFTAKSETLRLAMGIFEYETSMRFSSRLYEGFYNNESPIAIR